jgi:hypothetical protein
MMAFLFKLVADPQKDGVHCNRDRTPAQGGQLPGTCSTITGIPIWLHRPDRSPEFPNRGTGLPPTQVLGLHSLPAVALMLNGLADAGTTALVYWLGLRLGSGGIVAVGAALAWDVSPLPISARCCPSRYRPRCVPTS